MIRPFSIELSAMSLSDHPFRGPLFMVIATGSFVINDSFMKLSTEGLPPFEVLFLRGVAATIWCLPLLLALGYGKRIPMVLDRWVLLRNGLELLAVLGFVVGLANMPIADVTALGQITPLLVIIAGSMLYREKIGGMRVGLIALGFIGALMVAQPTMQGISVYVLLGLSNAVFCAARDIAGRRVPAEVPGLIVAFCAILVVMTGAGLSHLAFESWVAPEPHHYWYLMASGFFLIFGHFFIFMAYRAGPTGVVAPFYYFFTFWAVLSGVVVFGQFPNALAISGIALVVTSGLAIVLLDERKRRLAPVA